MKQPLTTRQTAVFGFLLSFLREEDRLPTHREITDFIGASSPATGRGYLQAFERKGYIEKRDKGHYRIAR